MTPETVCNPPLAALPNPAALVRFDGRFVACNAAFEALVGLRAEALRDETIELLFGIDTIPQSADKVRAAVSVGAVHTADLLLHRPHGAPFWADLTVWPSHSAALPDSVVLMLRDISARRDAEAAMLMNNVRYGFVLDRIQAGIVVHKATTEILYANARATELLGVTHDRMLGAVNTDPRWRFVDEHGETMPIEEYPVGKAVATRQVVRNLCIGLKRDSDAKSVWLMCSAFPVMDAEGTPTEVVVSFTDVTAIKEAEHALQKSEERLRLVLQGSTDAPWDWDLGTNELYYSPRWWQMIGYEPDELPNDAHLWVRLMHPEDHPRVMAQFPKELERGSASYEIEFRLQHKDGHWVTVLSRGFISRGANGVPVRVSGTNTDITERRAMEARLQQTQKMEAIGQLAGGVAHDFNNLLAVITGNLELLHDDLQPAGGDPLDLLEEALGATRKGAELTRRLLASTRQQALQPITVDVVKVVQGLVPVLRRVIAESIRIDTVIPESVAHICIDPGQFENAIINLAINSRDAMPRGGVLTIGIDDVVFDDETLPAEIDLTPGHYVRVTVTDNGAGMTPAVVRRSLEPFFTTKPVGRGTGLGLSMVYGFVKQSGGNLKIYSEPSRGTSVQLYLPSTEGAVTELPSVAAEIPRASAVREETVLVVEDDVNVRRFCLRCLASLGYRTIEAANGPAALEVLAAAPQVDLLLTDVVMPNGMNGPEVVAEARRRLPDLPVLYMSGYPAHMLDALDDRTAAQLLTKPFTTSKLAQAIRIQLDSAAAIRSA